MQRPPGWAGRLALTAALIAFTPIDERNLLRGEPTAAGVRIFYAPKTDLDQVDRQLIDGARRAIDMAAYVLTNRGVISALSAAARRGVRVRLYLDPDQAMRQQRTSGEDSLAGLLEAPNVETRFKARTTDMHMKAFQVDGRVLRSGSANFSFAGAKQQDNDAIVIESRQTAAGFVTEFERLWARRDNEIFQAGPRAGAFR